MKNIKTIKQLLISLGMCVNLSANSDIAKYSIPSDVTTLPASMVEINDNGLLSSEEVHYLINKMMFFPDISNNCEDSNGKCHYYVMPSVSSEGISLTGTNLQVFKDEDTYSVIEDIYEVYYLILSQTSGAELIKVENRLSVIDFRLKYEQDIEAIAALELEKRELKERQAILNQGVSEEAKAQFESYLRYALPSVGFPTTDDDTYEDLLGMLHDLRRQKVGYIHLYVDIGYSKTAVEITNKMFQELKEKNPKAEIEYTKPSRAISVLPAYSTDDFGDIVTDEIYKNANFMELRPGTTISPNGGTVVLDLTYDGLKDLRNKAKKGKSLSFPIRFEMNYDWEFKANASVECEYNKEYKVAVESTVRAVGEEEQVLVVDPPKYSNKLPDALEVMKCNTTTGETISKALKAKIEEIERKELEAMRDIDNQGKQQFASWKQIIENFSSTLNGRKILGKKKWEKIKKFEEKCEAITLHSSSSYAMGLVSSSDSRVETVCWQEYKEIIEPYYEPIEINFISKSAYEDYINRKFTYSFNGVDTIKRKVVPNLGFCSTLSVDEVGEISGAECKIMDQLNALNEEK